MAATMTQLRGDVAKMNSQHDALCKQISEVTVAVNAVVDMKQQLDCVSTALAVTTLVENGKQFSTAAFFVSCPKTHHSKFYDENIWPVGVEVRDWVSTACRNSSHCKRCTSYGNSVCLSVRLSHAGIVSKRRHIAWCSLHCQIAKYV